MCDAGQVEQEASQLLRAIRGKRSQVAFARRLGYRGNPITDWEHGRRFPTAAETLRACERAGIDVSDALARFHTAAPPQPAHDPQALAAWLDELRGSTPVVAVAAQVGRSRFALARWLSGQAEPRLPDFLRTVDALTGRLPDLVAALVPIAKVPSLAARHRTVAAARQLAVEMPWTEALLRVLETSAYRKRPHSAAHIARTLSLPLDTVEACLERLERAGIIRRDDTHFSVAGALTVDTRSDPAAVQRLLAHWSDVAVRRYPPTSDTDMFAYNVMSVSHADLARVRALLRSTFREVRAIVAASEPAETAALLNLQLIAWPDPSPPDEPPDKRDASKPKMWSGRM